MTDKLDTRCTPIGHAVFKWSDEDKGFGQFYFYVRNGIIFCDNESTTKEHIKQMLCDIVDESCFTTNDK